MTLAEFYAIDPLAAWAALSPDQQATIVGPLLTCAFAEVCQDDDGTDCSDADRETAARITQDSYQSMWDAVKLSFDILADDHSALHGFDASMLDDAGKVRVRCLRGKRQLRTGPSYYGHHIRLGGRKVEIAGFKNVSGPDEPEIWQAWTQAQVDAERVRRHPDQAIGPRQPDATFVFRSVLAPAASFTPAQEAAYDLVA